MWNAVGLQPHTLLQCSSIIYLGDIMSELKKNVGIHTYFFKNFSLFFLILKKSYIKTRNTLEFQMQKNFVQNLFLLRLNFIKYIYVHGNKDKTGH